MNGIKARSYSVEFKQNGFNKLEKLIENIDYSSVFVIVDTNTREHCLPVFKKEMSQPFDFEIINISPGEEFKTIISCQNIWQILSDKGADRKSLIINLGGGVITDMGGFIASTYKRGIDFVNIPTTLLSMVDASIGGKTGINFGNIKNQIGVITDPILVIIESDFLKTLNLKEYRSGYSEMLKHGLISDKDYWNTLLIFLKKNTLEILPLIYKSIEIKNKIVLKDPFEKSQRKILNFGHTIGHAIESYFIKSDHLEKLNHGEAIAIGMIIEASISVNNCSLNQSDADEIKNVFDSVFSKIKIDILDQNNIISLIKFDKKNSHGNVNFVLLKSIGFPIIDLKVTNSQIKKGFLFYNS